MFRRGVKDLCQGAVAVEFAIVLPFIFLLLSGVINFGLILANVNQLNSIVGVGMYYAFGNSSSTGVVSTQMTNATNMSPAPTITVSSFCQCLDGSSPGCGNTCSDGSVNSRFVTVTAASSVNLYALDFVLTNPFPTSVSGTIRTYK